MVERRRLSANAQSSLEMAEANQRRLKASATGMILIEGLAAKSGFGMQVACITDPDPKKFLTRLLLSEDRQQVQHFGFPSSKTGRTHQEAFTLMTMVYTILSDKTPLTQHIMGNGDHVTALAQHYNQLTADRSSGAGLNLLLAGIESNQRDTARPANLLYTLGASERLDWPYDFSRIGPPTPSLASGKVLVRANLTDHVELGVGLAAQESAVTPLAGLPDVPPSERYSVPLAASAEATADLYWNDLLDRETRKAVVVKTMTANGFVDYCIRQNPPENY